MPMRTFIAFLALLLVLWIAGASRWYVCRIRGDCKCCPRQEQIATDTLTGPENALRASLTEAKNYLTGAGKQIVYFGPSSANTDMNAIPAEYVTKLKLYLDNNPGLKVSVTGHTDISGSKAGNIKLSQARTDFVCTCLTNAGIKAEQIQALSKVDSEPAAPNNTSEGRAKNRRTEINLLN
jgi:outer membrane protein OmpA-like peptidoglycan-associated protein